MHATPPPPYTATQVVHLLGGPLDGESHEIPASASALLFDKDGDAQYWDGNPTHTAIPLAGHTYFYNPFATKRLGRETFTHATLRWDFGAPISQSGHPGQ
jgi:hypothetical protein